MTRYAVLADIHGNADALRAVLAEVDRLGIGEIINLGDHLSGPLAAGETAAILRARPMHCLSGNHDRYLVEQPPATMAPSDRVAREELTPDDLAWLRALPFDLRLDGGIYACHATPWDDEIYWLETVTPDGVPRLATPTEIADRGPAPQAEIVLCAHSHIPRILRPDAHGPLFVNPGSVGCPAYDDDTPVPHIMQTGSPQAHFAVIAPQDGAWTATLHAVPYDSRRMQDRALTHGRGSWAHAVRTGWFAPD